WRRSALRPSEGPDCDSACARLHSGAFVRPALQSLGYLAPSLRSGEHLGQCLQPRSWSTFKRDLNGGRELAALSASTLPQPSRARAVAREHASVRITEAWTRPLGARRSDTTEDGPLSGGAGGGTATGLKGLNSAGCREARGEVGPDEPMQRASAFSDAVMHSTLQLADATEVGP
ncbi:hypothetical protein NDU88_000412, partial [Pleurodeles waltl]